MLFVIDKVVTAEELAHIRGKFATARFGDGRVTAGELAAQAKHNLQLPEGEAETRALARLVIEALQRDLVFVSAVLPRTVYPPLFNRYLPGLDFGVHVDNAIRLGAATLRTDVSGTLFLSELEDYEGGTLIVEDIFGAQRVKLRAGDLVLYPSTSLHRVEPVTAGECNAAVFWVQRIVRHDGRCSLLLQLDGAVRSVRRTAPRSCRSWPVITTSCACGRSSSEERRSDARDIHRWLAAAQPACLADALVRLHRWVGLGTSLASTSTHNRKLSVNCL